jgi:tRNA modification GTPase
MTTPAAVPGTQSASWGTIVACATALPAHTAILRLSGDAACAIARAAGLVLGEPRGVREGAWPLVGGLCPVRVWWLVAPHSFTGEETVEIALPGAPDLVDLAIDALCVAGAQRAGPGDYARRALANGRLSLDRVEAILAIAHAGNAEAAQRAVTALRSRLADELEPLRDRLLMLRARVEAGLDFAAEEGVSGIEADDLARELTHIAEVLTRWHVGAEAIETDPVVALVGPANSGKSALFRALTGHQALVSPIAGTTRDVLEAPWLVAGRQVRLLDTAGWLDAMTGSPNVLDAAAISAGKTATTGACLFVACSAPDAVLPATIDLPDERTLVVATKADLGIREARAVVACSTREAAGCDALIALVAERIGAVASGSPRQARALAEALALCRRVQVTSLADEVLVAEDLVAVADLLGDVIGATTPDDVLNAIFTRFCIGK